jgi:transposase InsO family protein
LLLAYLRDQAGDPVAAGTLWHEVLARDTSLAATLACRQSAVCSHMPLPPSAYRTLVELEQQAAQPSPPLLEIEQAADRFGSVDLWALGAETAARLGDEAARRRFLLGGTEQAGQIGSAPTPLLALAQLHAARDSGDTATARAIAARWATPRNLRLAPQIAALLATDADLRLAQALGR